MPFRIRGHEEDPPRVDDTTEEKKAILRRQLMDEIPEWSSSHGLREQALFQDRLTVREA